MYGWIVSVLQERNFYRLQWLRRVTDGGIGIANFGEAEDGELYGVSVNRGLRYQVSFAVTP